MSIDAPVGTVVVPATDQAAAQQAALVNRARADLLASGSAVTVEQIAAATGKPAATVRQWLARQRAAGRLVTVTHDRAVYVPVFQLDEAFDLAAAASGVVSRLVGAGFSGWAVWQWANSPNTWLDGTTPAQALADGDTDAAQASVSGMLQD